MREAEVPVTFQPSGKTVYGLPGTRLLEAAAGAGIVVDQPCGGEGTCGKCRVLISRGACEPTPAERNVLSDDELRQGWRLACQTSVCQPTTVNVPETSLLDARQKILTHCDQSTQPSGDPPVRKRYIEMPPPRRGDDGADLSRLEVAVGQLDVELPVLRRLPRALREAAFQGTAVLSNHHLIDFEPGNTETENFAVAVDVGTTTLVAGLLDVHTGQELAITSRQNPQTRFGDDVLARILHAQSHDAGLAELQETLAEAIGAMVDELVAEAGIRRERIYQLSFSGNTTMQQVLCRISPRSLGEVPFVPAVGRGLLLPAAELGIPLHPMARAYVLPVIGGFVGGDAVSGMLATGLAEMNGPTLLVDIGTNGEIVLSANGRLWAASTAAGPAFEGARISQGMRGTSGAIEKVIVDNRLRTNVIGDTLPVGICGSGLIDLAAELLRHGVLSPVGRIHTSDQLPPEMLPDLAARVVLHDGQVAFEVVSQGESGTEKPIVLTQRDVRELQLATGAIRAGIFCLLRRAGLAASDLRAVLIAGGFGNFIRRSNAQQIGLLPREIPRKRIRYQGNTSLAGARLTALSRHARQRADELARHTEHVDLSTDPEFQTAFADAMIFPG